MSLVEDLGWNLTTFTKNDVIGLAVVYLIIAVSLVVYLYAKKHWKLVDSRKIVHIGVGHFVWIWWIFSAPWVMLVFFAIPFTAILFFAMHKDNAIGKSELGEISREGHSTGLFFYALAILILVALCFNDWMAATIGIVAMTFGDGMGSVIGRKYGKHKTINGKSWEGTLTIFAVTAVMAMVMMVFYAYLNAEGICRPIVTDFILPIPVIGMIAGLFAAVTETFCDGRYDNIVVASVVTMAMMGLGL